MAIHHLKYSDQELLLLIKEGQRQSFSYIYDIYSPILYGILLKAGLSEKYSCDILEQTFVKIWENKIATNDFDRTFLNWMIRVLLETTREYLTANNRNFKISFAKSLSISIKFLDT